MAIAIGSGIKSSITGSTITTGFVSSATGTLYTDRRDFYLSPQVVDELWKDVTPFISVLGRFGRKKTYDPNFKLFEHRGQWLNQVFYCGASESWTNDANTAMTVEKTAGGSDNVGYLCKGLLLEAYDTTMATRKAQFFVQAVTDQQTISVKATESSPTALIDGDVIVVVGFAAEEGSTYPAAWSDELETVWNSAAIFKTPVQVTGTLLAMTKLRGYSNELDRLRRMMFKYHKMKEAKALYFSRRYNTTAAPTTPPVGAGSRIVRTMHGIIPVIEAYSSSANVHSITMANYDWDSLVDDMMTWFEYGNAKNIKWLFGGDDVIAFFSKIGSSGFVNGNTFQFNINMSGVESKLGLNINSLTTPFGTIRLVRDRLFTQGFVKSATVKPFTGWGVLVDPEHIQKVMFRSDKYQTGLATNDYADELIVDQYFSDWGVGVTLAETHHLLKFQ